jgi:signal transduction histidine kinase
MRFNDMAGRIQRLIRSHKELSHAVSHELRTPIARIRFAMEMTRELPDSDKRENYFEAMNENIEELDGLVDELLTYARFDREEPKLDFEPTQIEGLTREVVARFEMTETNLVFNVVASSSVPIIADCDQDGVARVLDNLLRNAIRYAKKEVVVTVKESNGVVNIAVADDGPGVPQANWESLFDPFVRLDKSRDRNSGGIGLGLAIVRRYMEWHNGSVTIADADLGGAKFTLSWPLKHND